MNFFDKLQEETAAARQELLRVQIIQDALAGRVDVTEYLAFLSQAYHHVRHMVPLLMACGSRLPDRLGWLRTAISEYIEEEIGHEEWILCDIAACGGDPEKVRQSRPALETELMVAYAYHQIDRGNAVGFFGMVHVLEGTSTAIATTAADAIGTNLGLPETAFTYLTSHGNLDVEHVKFFARLMNQVEDGADQRAVIDCARAVYRLYGDIFRALPRGSRRAA